MGLEVRDILQELASSPRSRPDFQMIARRGRRLALLRKLLVALLVIGAFVSGLALTTSLRTSSFLERSSVGSTESNQTNESRQQAPDDPFIPETTNVTPVVVIATGQQEGLPWELEAKVVRVSEQGGGSHLSPCIGFHYPSDVETGVGSGMGCSLGHVIRPRGSDLFFAMQHLGSEGTSGGNAAYVGFTPGATKEVLLEHEDGTVRQAQLLEPTAEVAAAVDFKFFVGFAPEVGRVNVVAKDANAEILGSIPYPDTQ